MSFSAAGGANERFPKSLSWIDHFRGHFEMGLGGEGEEGEEKRWKMQKGREKTPPVNLCYGLALDTLLH